MKETERIADQLRRAMQGEAWHGPSLLEILKGVTAAQAAARPIAAAHSIWELVHHIAAWEAIALRRLASEVITDVAPEQDWPPVGDPAERDEAAWQRALAALEDGNLRLRDAVARFPDARLDEFAMGKDHSFYVMLQGVVQHDLYHAGQIALLKKAAR